ncbi:MAG: ABC transporter substrate-binding protein [Bacteroidota bacterium]|nr:ABC transporter substrate-binding protein [Bacteroidota bacterium]
MNILKFTAAVSIPAFILCSCGSPEGKFKEDDSLKSTTIDTSVKYIKVPGATKWDASWSTRDEVVYHWKGGPSSLHPTNSIYVSPVRVLMEFTQKFLISADYEHLTIRPDLVKALPDRSEDGLTWSYELRDEPTWDDGAQFSVDDVVFTIMAWECPLTDNAYARSSIENLKEIKRDPSNPRKFILVMKKPYIQNENFLQDMVVLQRKFHDPENIMANYSLDRFYDPKFANAKHPDLDKWAKEFNDPKYGRSLDKLNGLGAYKVTSWEDNTIVLTKKENHWTSKLKNPDMYNTAYPGKIIFKLNLDDNSIALELHQQVIDVSSWVSTRGLDELSKDSSFTKNYNFAFVQNFDYQFLAMNMKPAAVNRQPFFLDKRVRRAMALLTPVEELNKNYMLGKALRMTSLVSPIKREVYDNSLKAISYNLQEAKKLLDEAGWKDTDGDNIRDKMIDGKKIQFSCELLISSGPIYEQIAGDVANAMYPAGVKVNIRTIEFGAMSGILRAHQFDLYLGSWSGTFVTEDYKQIWHSSSYSNGGSNYNGYGTTASDALIDSIRYTLDVSKRIAMEKRLQQMVYDDQPYVFLFSSVRKVVIHKRFDNGDIYFEKPGTYLGNLRPMSPGRMATMTTIN